MHYSLISDWEDGRIFSVFRSPFLFPSIILHALVMLFVMRALSLNLAAPEPDAPITVQLAEFRPRGSVDKSIGARKGPGGPRELPKSGVKIPEAPRKGKLDSGSVESPAPKPSVQPLPPAPKPVALPGPKTLAANTRSEYVNANQTAPDSLVQLPTKAAPTQLRGGEATATTLDQNSIAAIKAGTEGPGIKALQQGAQIPGALRGTGTGTLPYGIPRGSTSGTGSAGGGTGVGTGGGSVTGLRGTSNADFSRYLEHIKTRVKSVWIYPDDVAGVQEVAVRFSLDRAGKLIQVEVLDSSDIRLNASALEAMKRASPFPPIPAALKDLADHPMRMSFTVCVSIRC